MGKRRVEITIISAEGLKLSSRFGKPYSYALAWIHPSKKVYTHVDQEGSKNPVWNHKLLLSIDTYTLERGLGKITIEIFHRGHVHDSVVGTVEVPLKEIPHEARFNRERPSEIQYMAFEIRRPAGKSKGILNLAIRLREVSPHSSSSSSSSSCDSQPNSPRTTSGNISNLPPKNQAPAPAPAPAYPSYDPVAPPAYPSYPPAPGNYPPSGYGARPSGYPYGGSSSFNRDYYPPQQGYGSGSGGYGGNPSYGSYQQPQPPQPQANYYSNPGAPVTPAKKGHSNLALGAGIAAGALGGLVLGEVVSDIAGNAAEKKEEEAQDECYDDDF